jgi:branched-chain amino acid aminotransferase
MGAVVNVNGRITDARDAVIPVFDHGFLYGEGVYETLRTYNRVPFLFDRHMRRLEASAARLVLDVPYSGAQMLDRIADTVAAAGRLDEAYIRILLTRGVGELSYDPKVCPVPSVVIIVKPHEPPAPRVFERGIRISLVSILRNHPGSVSPQIKSNNLLNNALAMQEAYRKGAEEGLMCNYRGELSECSQANFFLVKDGAALTPPIEAGLLEGVTRGFIFELGAGIGVPVRDAVLRPEDLRSADEAFITSTTREVNPVVQVDDRAVGNGSPGPITRKLLDAFRRRANELTQGAKVAPAS